MAWLQQMAFLLYIVAFINKKETMKDIRTHCGTVDISSMKQQTCGNNVDILCCEPILPMLLNFIAVEREQDKVKQSMDGFQNLKVLCWLDHSARLLLCLLLALCSCSVTNGL